MHWIFVTLALASSAMERPPCNARTQGTFWPGAANTDPVLRRAYMQDGSLEMCTASFWRYRWRSVVVNVREMQRTHAAR